MKSVQTYINAHAAARHYQQAEEQQIPQTQRGECNYDNDSYGDQVCLNKAR